MFRENFCQEKVCQSFFTTSQVTINTLVFVYPYELTIWRFLLVHVLVLFDANFSVVRIHVQQILLMQIGIEQKMQLFSTVHVSIHILPVQKFI